MLSNTKENKKKENKYNKDEIEYDEKRGNFFPYGESPNIFVNKLEARMQKYYNYLYKSNNSKTEELTRYSSLA